MAFVHNVFKHILSIGYEFETHDISKVSLVDDTFIVSDITNPGLKEKVKSGEANALDNHSFALPHPEYVNDPDMDGDVPNNAIMMHTTVDFNEESAFDAQLANCENGNKNSLYAFKLARKTYPIHFAEELEFNACSNFSGVEWIVTYYEPPSSPHIILNTYVDACSRIADQLHSFEQHTGKFIIRETKEVVGYPHRNLYHKPGTNLYLLQRNDGPDTNISRNTFTLDRTEIIPQMTFRVHAAKAMDVMQAMLTFTPTRPTRMGMNLKKLQEEFSRVYACATSIFPKNKVAACYLGLILFKVVVYVNRFSRRSEDSGYYFKDDLTFAVRHSNTVLYKRLKELVDVNLPFDTMDIYDYSKAALTRVVPPTHPGFGNPKVSLRSYFDYLEKGDWFEDQNIAKYIASFDFIDDTIVVEHREFGPTIATMMTDRNIHVRQFSPTLHMIQTLNDALVSEKQAKLFTGKILNPRTSRYTKKCRPGQIRDATFTCKNRSSRNRKSI
jgi:hypothetical protein